jgi:tRNA threonylcarbamoyladenosine biosynthesis protein TsaB
MNILALDTSSLHTCLVFRKEKAGRSFGVKKVFGRELSSLLSAEIKNLLLKARVKFSDIDVFAIGTGPGSFTSLRIGFATIYGLNLNYNKPVVGISSLDIIANNVKDYEGPICVIVDARRSLLYSCIYHKTKNGLKKCSPYLLIEPEVLVKRLPKNCLITGDGLKAYCDKFKKFLLLGEIYWYPHQDSLLDLALDIIKKSGLDKFNKKVLPLYLYPKDCQVQKRNLSK